MSSSHISVIPATQDFDAIEDAVMETAKGRWFLSEYARRLRAQNTDHVLGAITRIEAHLALKNQVQWRDTEIYAAQLDGIAQALRMCFYALREGEDIDKISHDLHRQMNAVRDVAEALRRPFDEAQTPPHQTASPQPMSADEPAPHSAHSILPFDRAQAFAPLEAMTVRARAAVFG